ncbi:MAG: hypothetical protein COT09_03400, partial [Candidatus Hydromicrobium americanum]
MSLPEARTNHSSVICGDKIYVIGGYDENWTVRNSVFIGQIEQDGSINKWTHTIPLPKAMYKHLSVIAGEKIYVFGGYDSEKKAVSSVYYTTVNPSTEHIGIWRPTTPFVYGREYTGIITGGKIYAVCGNLAYYSNINPDSTVGGWSKGGRPLIGGLAGHTALRYGDNIYVFGGYSSEGVSNKVYAVNTGVDEFTKFRSLALPEIWDEIWREQFQCPLPEPRYNHTTVLYGNKVYIIGGIVRGEFADTVYSIDFPLLSRWKLAGKLPLQP